MPIVDIRKDPEKLTMTVTAQFAAPVARVWAAYADPRQLERFWGPPEWRSLSATISPSAAAPSM